MSFIVGKSFEILINVWGFLMRMIFGLVFGGVLGAFLMSFLFFVWELFWIFFYGDFYEDFISKIKKISKKLPNKKIKAHRKSSRYLQLYFQDLAISVFDFGVSESKKHRDFVEYERCRPKIAPIYTMESRCFLDSNTPRSKTEIARSWKYNL